MKYIKKKKENVFFWLLSKHYLNEHKSIFKGINLTRFKRGNYSNYIENNIKRDIIQYLVNNDYSLKKNEERFIFRDRKLFKDCLLDFINHYNGNITYFNDDIDFDNKETFK